MVYCGALYVISCTYLVSPQATTAGKEETLEQLVFASPRTARILTVLAVSIYVVDLAQQGLSSELEVLESRNN